MLNLAHLMKQAERQINNKEQKMRNYKVLPMENLIWLDFLHSDVCVNLGNVY